MKLGVKITVLAVSGVVALGAISAVTSVVSLRKAGEAEVEKIRRELVAAKKEKLQDVVRNIYTMVAEAHRDANDPGAIADRYRDRLRDLVGLAYQAIESAYNLPGLDDQARQARARELVARLRYDGTNYFWINDLQPAMVMHPIKPQLDGKDLSRFEDPNGKRLFVAFVEATEKDGEGFVDYLWPKPGSDEPVAKLSFVKRFEPWGWIVGTGVYLEAAVAHVKEDLLRTIASQRYGPDGKDYFWVNDMDAVVLMHPIKPSLNGKDLTDLKDPDGTYIFREFVKTCREDGEGFVPYRWPKPGSDEPVRKLSYVRLFEPWNWVIGTGVYLDDIDAKIAQVEAEVKAGENRQIRLQAGGILGVTLLAAVVAGLFARRLGQPIARITETLRDIAEGEGDLTRRLPLAYKNCGEMKKCGHQECECYGKELPCWSLVGSMQPIRENVKCPSVLSGKITDCATCEVFQAAQKDELSEMANWFNIFAERVRYLVAEIKDTSTEMAATAEEMSGATNQMAASNEQVLAQAQAVATGSEEMSVTVQEVARSTQSVREASEQARGAAGDGGQVVTEAADALRDIARVVEQAAGTVRDLGGESEKIGTVVQVIEDIADQTNLLALNAAIEAARAGEHGRGFAVVADEVRKLAEKTVKATQEIADTVTRIQGESRRAVDAIDKGIDTVVQGRKLGEQAGDSMRSIEQQVADAADQTEQIAAATEELSATIHEMATNMDQIAKGVETNVHTTSDVANTARAVADRAEKLSSLAGRFKT